MHNVRNKPGKVREKWQTFHTEELYKKIERLCVESVWKQEVYVQFWLENPRGKDSLRHLGVSGRIMLRYMC